MSIAAFLSHSSKDRKKAGALKRGLEPYGVDVFVAHDDLQPTEEWQRVIVRRLRGCDVFFCLMSDNFRTSLWTDQETGMAVALRKHIVALKTSRDPYGFIAKYQALRVRKRMSDTCWWVAKALSAQQQFSTTIKSSVIEQFLDSATFEESSAHASRLKDLQPYSRDQMNVILEGSAKNQNIYGGRIARRIVRQLADDAPPDKKILRNFERQVSSWPY